MPDLEHSEVNIEHPVLGRPELQGLFAPVHDVAAQEHSPVEHETGRFHLVVEHLHSPSDLLAREEPGAAIVAVRRDGLIGVLMGLVERIGLIERTALDHGPGANPGDLAMTVAEDLHLPGLGLAQVAVAAVVDVGLVAEKDGMP